MAKDVMDLIQSDLWDRYVFYPDRISLSGRRVSYGILYPFPPDAEERKENISFVFQDQAYQTFEEFQENACIGGIKIYELEEPVEIVRAGIVGNDTMLKTHGVTPDWPKALR